MNAPLPVSRAMPGKTSGLARDQYGMQDYRPRRLASMLRQKGLAMPQIQTQTRGTVHVLTLNRPERLNAVTPELFDELSDALVHAREEARAVVLTGAGKGFCAGGDIRAPKSDYAPASRRMRRFYHSVMAQLDELDIPVIAAVNGPALGAGLSLAAAADLRLASERASFAAGFAPVGLSPDNGATYHLVRVLGYTRAFELLLAGVRLDAAAAREWGLVNDVVPHAELLDRAVELAGRLAAMPGSSVPVTKRLLKEAHRRHLVEQLESEARAFDETSQDPARRGAREAMRQRITS
ncbi:enoyl-CoA hydratase/isomerase family protein [Streptomyces sp. NPDC096310]|uniref:enoyl-CoA hydratase/isomerase family protein n=1 Tax=Streptomyces sp. NPDC096310 TaxID=3366082 RepID=UPI003824556A